jgi:hypothetical protein
MALAVAALAPLTALPARATGVPAEGFYGGTACYQESGSSVSLTSVDPPGGSVSLDTGRGTNAFGEYTPCHLGVGGGYAQANVTVNDRAGRNVWVTWWFDNDGDVGPAVGLLGRVPVINGPYGDQDGANPDGDDGWTGDFCSSTSPSGGPAGTQSLAIPAGVSDLYLEIHWTYSTDLQCGVQPTAGTVSLTLS